MVIRPLFFIFRVLRFVRTITSSFFTTVLDAAFPPRSSERLVRGLTPEALYARMQPIAIHLDHTYIGACIALFPYRLAEVEACIIEAKFHGSAKAAQILGYCLAKYLSELVSSHNMNIEKLVLVPIPLSASRLRERGYCQTERIAKAVVQSGCDVDTTLLARTRHTIPQTKLSGSQRRKNVEGAFTATKPCDPHHIYIVFDDVVTTGSTLLAAVEALRSAGGQHVFSVALAHADLHS